MIWMLGATLVIAAAAGTSAVTDGATVRGCKADRCSNIEECNDSCTVCTAPVGENKKKCGPPDIT